MMTLIANSFGTGITGRQLFYVVIKMQAGKWRETPPGLWLFMLSLIYYFATQVNRSLASRKPPRQQRLRRRTCQRHRTDLATLVLMCVAPRYAMVTLLSR